MKFINMKAMRFALYMLPIAAIAGFLIGLTMHTDEIALQISKNDFVMMTTLQTVVNTFIFGYFGHLLAGKVNMLKPVTFEKNHLLWATGVGLFGGLFFLFDYIVFGALIPKVAAIYTIDAYSAMHLVMKVFYGGIIEEILMRLFVMSLFAWILWKLFDRKKQKEQISTWVFVSANILSAFLFAAGHLPATVYLFGDLTGLIIFRCFLLNGIMGLLFGALYQKIGLHYAMIAHALTHVFAHIIFVFFVL